MRNDSKDLISRLRGRYPVGPIMENGEPEFGYRDMTGPAAIIIPPAIDLEAAKHIEKLEAELTSLRAKTACTMGVGDGSGKLFVHGDYDSIKAVQALVLNRSAPPDLLPGQRTTDIPWRRVQLDLFCTILNDTTVFDGMAILRCWNAMKAALEARIVSSILFDTSAVHAEVKAVERAGRTSPENVADVLDAVVRLLNVQTKTGDTHE